MAVAASGRQRVVWVSPLTPATGNAVTSARICGHLRSVYDVTLLDALTVSETDVVAAVADHAHAPPAVAVLVHAVRSGKFAAALRTAGCAYIVLFSGTDVSCHMPHAGDLDVSKRAAMVAAVRHATALVAFNPTAQHALELFWARHCVGDDGSPPPPPSVRVIPQAVDVATAATAMASAMATATDAPLVRVMPQVADVAASASASATDAPLVRVIPQAADVAASASASATDAPLVRVIPQVADVAASASASASASATDAPLVRVIPQAADVAASASASASATATAAPLAPCDAGTCLHRRVGLSSDARVVLLPCGLRPVKDPLFMVAAFGEWHAAHRGVHLVLVGPVLDAGVGAAVDAACATTPGVWRVPGAVDRGTLLHWMRQAAVVVNTSEAEGMCGAVMEAMAVGTVVAVRDNPGNRHLVDHGVCGLVFDTPRGAVAAVHRLVSEPDVAARLAAAASQRMRDAYGVAMEASAWLKVVASTHAAPVVHT